MNVVPSFKFGIFGIVIIYPPTFKMFILNKIHIIIMIFIIFIFKPFVNKYYTYYTHEVSRRD